MKTMDTVINTIVKTRFLMAALIILPVYALLPACKPSPVSPFSPSAVHDLSTFRLMDGFKMELVASEPIVFDPVDMMIDEYGRLYVVEMAGVPFNKSGIGKIVLLSDTNGDGKMDKRTVFADSLILPSGVMRWKKGIMVTDPPNVYYLEDTDNDGKADIRQVVLTGFDTTNLEANVNNPEYGLDNWIYLGALPIRNGGKIHFADDTSGNGVLEGTLRFRPEDHNKLELLSGHTQFGLSFDQWGHILMVNNSNHIFENVIPARYLERNPDMIVPATTETMADHNKVFPITINPEYQMLTNIGVFTSACGLVSYEGGAFPKQYNQDITFVCEPASNIVHADYILPNNSTLKAKSVSDKKEFLASTDPYSRMVNLYVGPDGSLYVIDFYRQVIEGPEFMAKEVLDTIDLYNGTHKGRIYRISKKDAPPPSWTSGLHLGDLNGEELVKKLGDNNIWWRINAQRLLVDRNDAANVPALMKMAENNQTALGRLHALWTLEGMGKLSADFIKKAFKDTIAGIRENAIRLAELHLSGDASLADGLYKMQDDPDAKVRLQLLLTLGYLQTKEADDIRQQLLFRNIEDGWMQIAALSARSSEALSLLESVMKNYEKENKAYASLVKRLSAIIGKSQSYSVIGPLIQKAIGGGVTADQWQSPLLEGLTQGLAGRTFVPPGIERSRNALMQACLGDSSVALQRASLQMLRVIGLSNDGQTNTARHRAVELAKDEHLPQDQRAIAIDFLSLQNPQPYAAWLKALVTPKEPLQVQLAALNALKVIPGTEISKYLLNNWQTLPPGVITAAVNTLMTSEDRINLLLEAIEKKQISLSDIDWVQSVRLRSSANMKIRAWARELFSRKEAGLKNLLQEYQAALSLKGNAERGKQIFQQNCAVCHQIEGKLGRAFGPDLGTVHAWAQADIMTNILDPNQSIAHGYDTWEITANNGESVQGVVSSESPTSITVNDANGQSRSISRLDIQSMKALNISAMPAGWEDKITKQQMADLITFLKFGE